MKLIFAFSLASALALGAACGHQSTTNDPSAPQIEPSQPAPVTKGSAVNPSASSKCVQQGGTCGPKGGSGTATCARYETGADWGCTNPDDGCCFAQQ